MRADPDKALALVDHLVEQEAEQAGITSSQMAQWHPHAAVGQLMEGRMEYCERPRPGRTLTQRPFLNTRQAAFYVGLSARHLERMRRGALGPRFRRHGRFVFYHIADLDAWSEANADGTRGDD